MKRKIIHIDENLCNGCSQCVTACAESAIKIINGKAKIISDQYCDGLGHCLGHCPTGALTIVEREAEAFQQPEKKPSHCQCPSLNNHLPNWPIQLSLVPPQAEFLKNKEIVIAADCTAFSAPNIHQLLSKNSALLIGCPKLDDARGYIEKLTQIFQNADPLKVTVIRMEVPCCRALSTITQSALLLAHKTSIGFDEKIIFTASVHA